MCSTIDSYRLIPNDNQSGYTFITDNGTKYQIAFIRDYTLEGFEVYQFTLVVEDGEPSRKDKKIQNTVTNIIEQFFESNQSGLLYICDTNDGRQSVRDRLFSMWYRAYPKKERFTYESESIEVESVNYYISLLIRNDNPFLQEMRQSFKTLCNDLRDKWQE